MFLPPGKIVALASALSGAFGTLLLFKGSFAYEQTAYWGSADTSRAVTARNRRREILQRLGLLFLMVSFVLAGLSVLLDD